MTISQETYLFFSPITYADRGCIEKRKAVVAIGRLVDSFHVHISLRDVFFVFLLKKHRDGSHASLEAIEPSLCFFLCFLNRPYASYLY